MKSLKWTLTSLVLLGIAQPLVGQQIAPGLQPPAPPAGVNPMGGAPMGNGPMMNPNSALPGGFQGAPVQGDYGAPPQSYSGGEYSGGGYEQGTFAGPANCGPGYDGDCPPVFDNVWSSPGTFFFRAEAFMLRRSQHVPNRALVQNNAGTTLLSTDDLHFRNEVGQRFEAGYEFNECATIGFTFWEVQDWNPTNGVVSAANDLTIDGAAGTQSANFTNASSIQAGYRTMMKNYEINWTNATIFDRFSVLAGFRYIDMIDRLAIVSTRDVGPVNTIGTSDYIMRNTNRLLGGQIGAKVRYDVDLWTFEFLGKSGLYDDSIQFSKFYGDTNNTVDVNPQTNPPVAHSLAAVNEVNLSFMRKLGNHLAVRAGYTAMWITNVGLAADQYDPSINHVNNQVVREGGDLFLYGVNVGADVRY